MLLINNYAMISSVLPSDFILIGPIICPIDLIKGCDFLKAFLFHLMNCIMQGHNITALQGK